MLQRGLSGNLELKGIHNQINVNRVEATQCSYQTAFQGTHTTIAHRSHVLKALEIKMLAGKFVGLVQTKISQKLLDRMSDLAFSIIFF